MKDKLLAGVEERCKDLQLQLDARQVNERDHKRSQESLLSDYLTGNVADEINQSKQADELIEEKEAQIK